MIMLMMLRSVYVCCMALEKKAVKDIDDTRHSIFVKKKRCSNPWHIRVIYHKGKLSSFKIWLQAVYAIMNLENKRTETSQSTAIVMSGWSVHLTTFFSLASLTKQLTSTSCTYFRM